MSSENRRIQAIQILDEMLSELSRIMHNTTRDYDYSAGEKCLRTWKTRAVKRIAEAIHPDEGEKLLKKHAHDSGTKRTQEIVEENVRLYRGFLLVLKDSLRNGSEGLLALEVPERPIPMVVGSECEKSGSALMETSQQLHNRKIFIIFGRDELNSLRLEKFLSGKGLQNLVLLNTLSGKSPYLIDKLEQEASWDSWAFFIFTPEDFVRKSGVKSQLVRGEFLFGLGWFCGKFGHQRLCVLSKKGANLPPGLADFVGIEFEDSINDAEGTITSQLHDLGFE
tara:strand:- start:1102 stop:1941 length:840 start_codon:yes stop_codon:yes gene_type:complete